MYKNFIDIPEFEGLYKINKFGDVLTIKFNRLKVNGIDRCGYKNLSLYKDGKPYHIKVHQLVARIFLGASDGLCVNHKDGNKENNHVSNLEYITQKENIRHAWSLGLCNPSQGNNHYRSKINTDDVIKIRQDVLNGISYNTLSKRYNMSASNLSRVARGKIWKSVVREVSYL